MGETKCFMHEYIPVAELPQPCQSMRAMFLTAKVMENISLDMMKYEELRLVTFWTLPRDNKPDIFSMAVAGFYYSSDGAYGDAVTCYCCGLSLRGLKAEHNPMEMHSKMSEHCTFISHNKDVNESVVNRTPIEKKILQTVDTYCDKKESKALSTEVKYIDDFTAYQEKGYIEHPERNQIAISAAQHGAKVKAFCNITGKHADESLANCLEKSNADNQAVENLGNNLKERKVTLLEEKTQKQETTKPYNESNSNQFVDLGISLRKSVSKARAISDCSIDLKEKHSQKTSIQIEGEFISLHEKQTNISSLRATSHWVQVKEIGRGAFCRCYKDIDADSGAILARKKLLWKDGKSDERNEFRLLKGLCHPNIIRVLWEKFTGDTHNILMEYMSGGSVGDLLQRTDGLNEQQIIHYIRQTLHGVHYLHSKRILHRDLKGENLLIGNHYELKIGDFGSATKVVCIINGVAEKSLIGTVPFMAPEVARDQRYSGAGDVWSVGCCIIQMATAKLPWSESNFEIVGEMALLFKIGVSYKPPPIPNRLSPSLKKLAMYCLAMNKEERPTAKELLNDPMFLECREDDYEGIYMPSRNVHETF